MKNLKDKVVLITGGASGIGRASAIEFAKLGAKLVLADVNEKGMKETADETAKYGSEILLVKTDISKEKDVENLVKKALDKFSRVDVLLNNAGVGMSAEIRDMTIPEWEWILGINLWGTIYTTHYLLPHMVEQGSGHIVNVSSAVGLVNFVPMQPAYTTIKFALVGFSEVLRTESERFGIGVTAICPGSVDTNFFETTKYKGYKRAVIDDLPKFMFLSPEKIAKKIIHAVKKNKALIIISGVAKIAYFMNRLSPALGRQLAKKNMKLFLKYKD